MASLTLKCPLCFQSSFQSVPSLCLNLISVTTRLLECPICHETLFGLDKFTIHLFSHTFNQQNLMNLHAVGVCGSRSQEKLNSNFSNASNLCAEDKVNQELLSKMVGIDHETLVNNKTKELKNDGVINGNHITEKLNENLVKFVDSNEDNHEKIQNTGHQSRNYHSDLPKYDLKKPNRRNCVTESSENSHQCDNLKKKLEPFLKYHDKPDKLVKESVFGEDLKKPPSSFDVCSNADKVSSLNTKFIDSNCTDEKFYERNKVSSDRNKNLIGFSDLSDTFITKAYRHTNISVHKPSHSSEEKCFMLNTISHKTVKKKVPRINGLAKFSDDNHKNVSCDVNMLNIGYKNNSTEDFENNNQVYNLYQENVLDVNNVAHKNTTGKNSTLKGSANHVGTLCKMNVGGGKFINDTATNNPVSPITTKEVASQAIQTVEESFTKANSRNPNCCNETAVIVLNESKNNNPECTSKQSNSAMHCNNFTSPGFYDNDNHAYSCEVCLFKFPDEQILNMHKQLVHSDDFNSCNDKKKSYSCHLCTKSFKMRGSLMVHRRVAHPSTSVLRNLEAVSKPNDENSPGTLSASTSTTILDQLSPNGDQLFPCNMCGKPFKKEQHLIQHEKTHEVKQWECDVCSKAFSTKYFLKKHRRLHTGEMPYTCSTCGKSFTFQQSYHKHLLYHSDEKPYVCCDCGRAFKELSTLHNHQRIHTGEKPFSCESCGKCFRQRVSYLVHRRIHTGVMPYRCSVCNRSFRYKVSERTHKCVPLSASKSSVQLTGIPSTTKSCEVTDGLNVATNNLFCNKSPVAEANIFTVMKDNAEEKMYEFGVAKNNRDDPSFVNLNVCWQNDNEIERGINDKNNDNIVEKNVDNGGKISRTEKDKESVHSSPPILQTDLFETTDFFSLILSPTMSSPSEHLRQLTLSPNSSQNWENPCPSTSLHNISISDKCSINNHDIGVGNDTVNTGLTSVDNEVLETINEQSFKELLFDVSYN